jgi:hypothetical protein
MQPTIPTIRTMAREIGTLIVLFVIALIPTLGQPIALCILIVMVFGCPTSTFKCLVAGVTVTFITITSVKLFSGGSILSVGPKWILLFAACARSLVAEGQPTRSYGRLMKYWGYLTGLLVINAIFVSAVPAISAFKAISFSLGLLCVIRLAMLTSDQNAEMLLFVSEMGTAVTILSIPLLPLDIGWAQLGGAYFNGIFFHPQALGVFLVMTGAASFVAAFKLPQLQRELIVCGLAQWSMIYFTRCRTALVAILLGGIIYIIEVFIRGGKSSRVRFVSVFTILISALGITLALMLFPNLRESAAMFVRKGNMESFTSTEERLAALSTGTRGVQINSDLDVIAEHPVFGYGFGVSPGSEGYLDPNTVQLWGVPLSAPIEQGFLPLATLAQIGVVGSLFIIPFLFSMYLSARRSSAEDAGLFVAVIGVNFGEMIFYSFGSMGGLVWVMLVFLAVGGSMSGSHPEY